MKKTLTILLVCILSITITACASNNSGNYEVSLGDGLPTYSSDIRYKEDEVSEEQAKNFITNIYTYDDKSKLVLYRWRNDGSSLEEIAKNEIEKYYPSEYKLTYTVLDEWELDGDSHYSYYMSYIPTGYNQPYYLQNFFFESGNDIIKAEFWLPAIRMNLPIKGWTIDLPVGYENGGLLKDEITDDALTKFITSYDTEYPELNIYRWEDVYDSLEDYATNELSTLYDMTSYDIYKYEDINGNKHDVLLSIYDEDDEGVMETNYDYTFDIGDDYMEFDFFVEQEDDYVRFAIPALAASIAYKNK